MKPDNLTLLLLILVLLFGIAVIINLSGDMWMPTHASARDVPDFDVPSSWGRLEPMNDRIVTPAADWATDRPDQ